MVDAPYSRPGWTSQMISVATVRGTLEITAICYGQLAVHRMLTEDGWAITLIARGLRMSSGYRVFETREAACDLVEEIYPINNDWGAFFDEPRRQEMLDAFNDAHDRAAERGAFLSQLVAPTRIGV